MAVYDFRNGENGLWRYITSDLKLNVPVLQNSIVSFDKYIIVATKEIADGMSKAQMHYFDGEAEKWYPERQSQSGTNTVTTGV